MKHVFGLPLFDRVVVLVCLCLALGVGLLAWRGDRAGLRVAGLAPGRGAMDVSPTTAVRVTFARAPQPGELTPSLTWEPPVDGAVRWEGRTLVYSPATPLLINRTYTLTLTAGTTTRWSFRTGRRILYLGPDASGRPQLFEVSSAGDVPRRFTAEPGGLSGYTLAPDGSTVVYGALGEDGSQDLWAISPGGSDRHLLLACPGAECGEVAWSARGQVVYTRTEDGAGGGRLWWLDPNTLKTSPVFENEQEGGSGATWSADGKYLAYITGDRQGVRIYDMDSGRNIVVPGDIVQQAVWSPQADVLLISSARSPGPGAAIHLLRVDVESNQVTDLSGDDLVEDTSPVWSPDGRWIAFSRRTPGVPMGGQLWLMQADGGEAHAVTHDPAVQYIAAAWTQDGQQLLLYHFAADQREPRPAIALLDPATNEMGEIAAPGEQPAWLP